MTCLLIQNHRKCCYKERIDKANKGINGIILLLALGALFLTLLEYLAETWWTRCYTRISDVGLVT